MNLLCKWIEWNEKKITAEDFCMAFKEEHSKQIDKIIKEKNIPKRYCRLCKSELLYTQQFYCSRYCSSEGRKIMSIGFEGGKEKNIKMR